MGSFFDAFFEISLDGGATWIPSVNGSARLTLVPEPGTAMLAGLTGSTILMRRRRHTC